MSPSKGPWIFFIFSAASTVREKPLTIGKNSAEKFEVPYIATIVISEYLKRGHLLCQVFVVPSDNVQHKIQHYSLLKTPP